MKKNLILMLLALPMLALLLGFSGSNLNATTKNGEEVTVPYNAVALVINGTPHLLTNRVVWNFPGGGQIDAITFFMSGNQPYMKRTGHSVTGADLTDLFEVNLQFNYLLYTPTVRKVCYGASSTPFCSTCRYVSAEDQCICMETGLPDGCNLHTIDNFPLSEVVIVN